MREFDTDTLLLINAFERMTGTEVRDCIVDSCVFFLINKGKMGAAIGKNGNMIKSAENMLKRPIKVYEWDEDPQSIIKNMIPQAQKIEVKDNQATITVNAKDRGMIIGKSGNNIKIIRELLERNSNIKDLRIV